MADDHDVSCGNDDGAAVLDEMLRAATREELVQHIVLQRTLIKNLHMKIIELEEQLGTGVEDGLGGGLEGRGAGPPAAPGIAAFEAAADARYPYPVDSPPSAGALASPPASSARSARGASPTRVLGFAPSPDDQVPRTGDSGVHVGAHARPHCSHDGRQASFSPARDVAAAPVESAEVASPQLAVELYEQLAAVEAALDDATAHPQQYAASLVEQLRAAAVQLRDALVAATGGSAGSHGALAGRFYRSGSAASRSTVVSQPAGRAHQQQRLLCSPQDRFLRGFSIGSNARDRATTEDLAYYADGHATGPSRPSSRGGTPFSAGSPVSPVAHGFPQRETSLRWGDARRAEVSLGMMHDARAAGRRGLFAEPGLRSSLTPPGRNGGQPASPTGQRQNRNGSGARAATPRGPLSPRGSAPASPRAAAAVAAAAAATPGSSPHSHAPLSLVEKMRAAARHRATVDHPEGAVGALAKHETAILRGSDRDVTLRSSPGRSPRKMAAPIDVSGAARRRQSPVAVAIGAARRARVGS